MSRTIAGTSAEPGSAVTGKDKRWMTAAGLAAVVVVGWLLAYPLLAGELLIRQLIGSAMNAPWAPFGADDEGKTQLSAIILIVIGGPLLAAAVAIVRSMQRRLDVQGWRATTFYLASIAALLAPFLVAKAGAIGIDTLLGSGWLW